MRFYQVVNVLSRLLDQLESSASAPLKVHRCRLGREREQLQDRRCLLSRVCDATQDGSEESVRPEGGHRPLVHGLLGPDAELHDEAQPQHPHRRHGQTESG